jgi:hypothetical protein
MKRKNFRRIAWTWNGFLDRSDFRVNAAPPLE